MTILSSVIGSAIFATDKMAFNNAKFDSDIKSGKSIMVGVHADWCPTCKKQSPIIDGFSKEKKFSKMVFYKVNFDADKGFLKKYNVEHQSTLIIFKGNKEVARSTGETDSAKIRALLEQGL
jgi:thiol-disulfide isomerase/thioredoxin